jgi:hypothetical protein
VLTSKDILYHFHDLRIEVIRRYQLDSLTIELQKRGHYPIDPNHNSFMEGDEAETIYFYNPNVGLIWNLNATESIVLRTLDNPTLDWHPPPGVQPRQWYSYPELAAKYMRTLHDAETPTWILFRAPSA